MGDEGHHPSSSLGRRATAMPPAEQEFASIRDACPVLAPSGCNAHFCQAGRMIHTNEPRVGRDRPISEVHAEAVAFLEECRKEGIIQSDAAFELRVKEVVTEISKGSKVCAVTKEDGTKEVGLAGGSWTQTHEELLYGIRLAWLNARKCIMRSQWKELELCDLRHVTRSREMAQEIISGIEKAFGNGVITPTVFMFPPRQVGKRGPMLWNGQIFAFAGYRTKDGSTLGDPANIDLTEAITHLGWKPPKERSNWDLLPIVTMAEDDVPVVTELPPNLKRVVQIQHPKFQDEFKALDMKWVIAPALSRLGFDIGGVQYTASPFMGWFMDGEIGVRNLGDTFRYNMLPKVANALRLHGRDEDVDLDDLPEFERLAALSRAQAELNYAVTWSYMQSKISIVDALTASAKWTQFDDEHRREKGYRLPADPYWLMAPHGSIIPVWHRGGAPNYQPKPVIARHVQDPIKAWYREQAPSPKSGSSPASHRNVSFSINTKPEKRSPAPAKVPQPAKKLIRIYFCTNGTTAVKVASKLHTRTKALAEKRPEIGSPTMPAALNELDLSMVHSGDVVLLVVSTTGRGEVPTNGSKFVSHHSETSSLDSSFNFAIFGIGDSAYTETFNAAGIRVEGLLARLGLPSIAGGLCKADSSIETPPWDQFEVWWETINGALLSAKPTKTRPSILRTATSSRALPVITAFPKATLCKPVEAKEGVVLVSLDLGEASYHEMDLIKVFPPQSAHLVERTVRALGVISWEALRAFKPITISEYLRECVDLLRPFKTMSWITLLRNIPDPTREAMRGRPVVEALEMLRGTDYSPILFEVCMDMATSFSKTYSVASSPLFSEGLMAIGLPTWTPSTSTSTSSSPTLGPYAISNHDGPGHALRDRTQIAYDPQRTLDILVKIHDGGRFSQLFLGEAEAGATMRYKLSRAPAFELLGQQTHGPVICVVTGSGIGPVRSLLQRRAAETANAIDIGTQSLPYSESPISLFVGFKPGDAKMVEEAILPGKRFGLLDICDLTPSGKVRVQSRLLARGLAKQMALKLQDPQCLVFVCANEAATEATERNLSHIMGTDAKKALGPRYMEELFKS